MVALVKMLSERSAVQLKMATLNATTFIALLKPRNQGLNVLPPPR
jgi:hypothetical protein